MKIILHIVANSIYPMTIGDIHCRLTRDGHEFSSFDLYVLMQNLRRNNLVTYAPVTAAQITEARRQNPAYDDLLTDRDDLRDYIWEIARYVATTDNPCNALPLFRDE